LPVVYADSGVDILWIIGIAACILLVWRFGGG
jgi:hypothetical protein